MYKDDEEDDNDDQTNNRLNDFNEFHTNVRHAHNHEVKPTPRVTCNIKYSFVRFFLFEIWNILPFWMKQTGDE